MSNNNNETFKIALKLIKNNEKCCLKAYPDPCSDLSKALVSHGKLKAYKEGKFKIPKEWSHLKGSPWTIGWGCTGPDIKEGVEWTQERADSDLTTKLKAITDAVLKASPKLSNQAPERLAACIDMAYNVGVSAYTNSTVAKKIAEGNNMAAADAFLMWNKAGGKTVQGLVNRCNVRRNLFLSVRG